MIETDSKLENYAFIDGQNLHLGTTSLKDSWKIDLYRFRIYLARKYNVTKAYYFLGVVDDRNSDLYINIQDAGFIIVFRQHSIGMLGKKKGNVDSDLIFYVMKNLYKKEKFDRIVLVSGDGDYKMLVDFLIEENRFEKILFPAQIRSSSLYKKIESKYKADLNTPDIRKKIAYNKKKGRL